MGRFVDLSKPLSDEDREYLIERRREDEIRFNDAEFGDLKDKDKKAVSEQHDSDVKEDKAEQEAYEKALAEADEEGYPEHLVEKVEPLTVAQLRAALKKRDLETSGDKEELRIRLIEFLEEKDKEKETAGEEAAANLRKKEHPDPPR